MTPKQSDSHFFSVDTPSNVSVDTQVASISTDEYNYYIYEDDQSVWQSTSTCNTRSKYHSSFGNVSKWAVGVDWLQGVGHFPDTETIKERMNSLAEFVGDEILWNQDIPFICGVFWQHRVSSIFGITVAWNDAIDGKPARCLIILPGKFWANLEAKFPSIFMCQIFVVFSALKTYQFRATRLDSRLDDFSKTITFEMLDDAVKARNFALVKKTDPHRPISLDPNEDLGWTVYFGSPKSDKYVRIYDKSIESNGAIDAIRLEVQYRDERANTVFQDVCENLPNFIADMSEEEYEVFASQYYAGLVTGAVSFVDRTSGDRLSRQSLLPWWESFINAVADGIRVPSSRPQSSPEKTEAWMYKIGRCFCRQALLLRDKFHDYIDDIVNSAEPRMNSSDYAYVRVYESSYNWRPSRC